MMKDNSVIFLFIAILAVIALSFTNPNFIIQDLPQEPNPPSFITGFALAEMPSWATVNDLQLSTEVSGAKLYVKVENADFVYKNAYIYTRAGKERFELSGNLVVPSNWLLQKGEATIDLTSYNLFPGENYVVGYACKKIDAGFDCNGMKWVLGTFFYAGPESPQDICVRTGGSWGLVAGVETCACAEPNFFDINRGCVSPFECVQEGDSKGIYPDAPPCCEGLKEIGCDKADETTGECKEGCAGASFCTNCGDGICGLGENKCNCPSDCIIVCPTLYEPVCGIDGKTYANDCVARLAILGPVTQKETSEEPAITTHCECPAGMFCQDDSCTNPTTSTCVAIPQVCPDVYEPVCGCDGKTYGNACGAAASGVSKAYDGECTAKTCAAEGERYSRVYTAQYPANCCEGLTEWPSGFDTRKVVDGKCVKTDLVSGLPVGTCINCGNGVCEGVENICNCPEDCGAQATCPQLSPPAPGWCEGGKIVSGVIDEKGCMGPPKCVMSNVVAYNGRCCSECGAGILNSCDQSECLSLGNSACAFTSVIGTLYGTCTYGEQQESVCTDSDGGKVYDTKGTTTDATTSKTDNCWDDGKTIAEYYCSSTGAAEQENYPCPGSCQDGVCVAAKCAAEGEYTTGAVAPEYYVGCCAGLEGFNTNPGLVGGGMLCYDPTKGTPICKSIGTRSEGWYYSTTGGLIKYEACGTQVPTKGGCTSSAECPTGMVCTSGSCVTAPTCAAEKQGITEQLTSCCKGLIPFQLSVGTVCYNPAKGTPKCSAIGSKSEGWYYSTGGLIAWDNCG